MKIKLTGADVFLMGLYTGLIVGMVLTKDSNAKREAVWDRALADEDLQTPEHLLHANKVE